MKIGFFGGSFNPPSYIHINLAKELINKNIVEKVVFVPVGNYYQKDDLIDVKHRLSMLKLAIQNEINLAIDEVAADSKIKLFASDTFKLIKEKYKSHELFFIMGSDNFRKMPSWKNYKELLNNYNIIVLERERKKTRNTSEKNILEYIPEKLQKIDSSKIRNMIKNNENVSDFVNKKVVKYIEEKKLYK